MTILLLDSPTLREKIISFGIEDENEQRRRAWKGEHPPSSTPRKTLN
jgi:hypothetical protein